jgi:AbiV
MDVKLLKKINAGAEKILENAVALYREAVLLAEYQAWSRALFLHQISMEECAKVEVVGANRELPIALYGGLQLTSGSGLREYFQLSRTGIGPGFRAAVCGLATVLSQRAAVAASGLPAKSFENFR